MRQLALVAELDQAGSLHKAAERLGMSQPAATRLLQALEQLMDGSLFERTNRGMVATDLGRLLIRHASMVLSGVDHVQREAQFLRSGNAGMLRIGLFAGAPPTLLAAAVASTQDANNRTLIHVEHAGNESLLAALRDGALDIVVGRAPSGPDRQAFLFEVLFIDHFSVVCAMGNVIPPAAAAGLAGLIDFRWILPFPGTALRSGLDVQFLTQCGRLPANAVESISASANVALMGATGCLAVMPNWIAREYVATGQLRIVVARLENLTGPIGLVTRTGEAPRSQVRQLVEALRSACRSHHADDSLFASPAPKI